MDLWERLFSQEDKPHVGALTEQIRQLHQAGHHDQALELGNKTYELARRQLRGDEPEFAALLNILGILYAERGDTAKATDLLQQALGIWRAAFGEQHPEIARGLGNLAGVYEKQGDYKAAEQLFQQALEMMRISLGEQHPDYATALNNLASLYYSMGKFAAAEPLFKQALDITRTALGQEHPDVAQSLGNLGTLYGKIGHYKDAERYFLEALQLGQNALGEHHPYIATILNGLAALYYETGNYAEAEPFYLRALKTFRTLLGEQHPNVAQVGLNLAVLYQKTGKFDAAEKLYRQAQAIFRGTFGEEHPIYAQLMNNMGVLYRTMGYYTRAEPLYRQALEIRRKTLGENHPSVAATTHNLAALYQAMGDYRSARMHYQQANALLQRSLGDTHPMYATNLNNLSLVSQAMGDYQAAIDFQEQALAIRHKVLGEKHEETATSRNNLGLLHLGQSNYETALHLFEQALEILHSTVGKEHYEVALTMNNLAVTYQRTGNYQAAEHFYRQSLEVRRATLGKHHPSEAIALTSLGVLCAATGRDPEALSLMQQAATVDEQTLTQVFTISSEDQRMAYLSTISANFNAFLSLIVQRFAADSDVVRQAFDLVLRRKAIGAEALAIQRDAILGGKYPSLKETLWTLGLLRMQIAEKLFAGPGGLGLEEYRQQLDQWQARREELERALAHQILEIDLDLHLRVADREAVAKALPEGSVLVEFIRITMIEFRAIPAQGEQRSQPAHYLAFVLWAHDPDNVQMIDLGEAESIDRMIDVFRNIVMGHAEQTTQRQAILRRRRSFNRSRRLAPPRARSYITRHATSVARRRGIARLARHGTRLRQAVFDQLLPAVADRTRLFLSPDGDLTQLPFEALPTGAGRYLIDDYSISYLSVGRDVLRFDTPRTGPPGGPIIIAAPDFNLGSSTPATKEQDSVVPPTRLPQSLKRALASFSALPGTHIEGLQIAGLLKESAWEVTLWMEQAALESRLKNCVSPYLLHIATHGFFLPDARQNVQEGQLEEQLISMSPGRRLARLAYLENPLLRSGLALAGANTWLQGGIPPVEAENGILTAEDVTGLDLLHTELVVLSACETGRGFVHTGEGVFGLRRAFVLAGARTLVMSLWAVPDQQTQTLMVDYYQRIMDGQPRAEALRAAQLKLKEQDSAPLNWGAFICQGTPYALPLQPPAASQ